MEQKYLIFIFLPCLGLSQKLTTVQFAENLGYPCETHYITTEDGYILTFHRIPHGVNKSETNKPAVLLVHGMCSSSADYVNLGSERSLGFILANLGYDVWLANSRGNSYSKNHTVLNPKTNPKKFYDFSWHEMGLYDTPAAIDYILNLTGDSSLHYIGLSQGTTSFLVFASQLPEYSAKIKLASLMAPAAIIDQLPTMSLTLTIYKILIDYFNLLKQKKVYYLQTADSIQNLIIQCNDNKEKMMVCKMIMGMFGGGFDQEQFDDFVLPIVGMNFPSEISLKQLEHYLQQIRNGGFRPFDYDTKKNLKIYHSPIPADYDVSKIIIPMAFYVGKSDTLAGPSSVKKLMKRVPPLAHYYEVPHEHFTHMDFAIARDVKKLVYDEIIKVMKIYD